MSVKTLHAQSSRARAKEIPTTAVYGMNSEDYAITAVTTSEMADAMRDIQ